MSTAARVGSINVILNTDIGGATKGLNAFAGHVERTGVRTKGAVNGIDRNILSLNNSMNGIGRNSGVFSTLARGAGQTRISIGQLNSSLLTTTALIGGLAPIAAGAYLVKVSDRAILLSNNLRVVTNSTEELKSVEEELFQVAQRTRSSFEATATIYARTARATDKFGISQKNLLRITETINKAFAAGGASPAEAKGAAIQLTQGIASDRFSGDEFRSVAENAPMLLKGIGDSLGVNIGKLREMAHAGQLTAKVVTEAILKSSGDIDAAFDKTVSTIGQAFVKLDNAVLKYVSDSENASVASQGIVTIVDALSENLETVTDALLVVGGALAFAFGGRRLSQLGAYLAALNAQVMAQERAAAAVLERARAEVAAAAMERQKAASRLANLNQTAASERQLERARNAVIAKTAAYEKVQQKLNDATDAHSRALRLASRSGKAFALAGRAASAAWSFIGGPIGAALLAVGAAMYAVQREAMAAEAMTARYADAIAKAGKKSQDAGKGIRAVAKELHGVAEGMSIIARQNALKQATKDVEVFGDKLKRAVVSLVGGLGGTGNNKLAAEIDQLKKQFDSGGVSASEFISKLNVLSALNPEISRIADDVKEIIENYEAARGAVDAYTESLKDATKIIDEIKQAESDLGTFADTLTSVRGILRSNAGSDNLVSREFIQNLTDLGRLFNANNIGLAEYLTRTDELRKNHPDMSGTIDGFQNLAKQIVKNADRIDQLKAKLAQLDGTHVEITVDTVSDAIDTSKLDGVLEKLHFKNALLGLSEINGKIVELSRDAGLGEQDIKKLMEAFKTGGEVPEEFDQIRKLVQENARLEEARRKSRNAARKSQRDTERQLARFQSALDRLDYQSATLGLSELDKKTVDIARNAGVADEKIRAFLASASTGGEVPEELAQIRNRLQEISALEFQKSLDRLSQSNVVMFLSDVERKTIETARSFGVAEEEVRAFIRAASAGDLSNISDSMAQIRDRVNEISQNERFKQTIDDMASAYGNFVKSAITGSESFKDALSNLLDRLIDVYVEMLIIEPLMDSLKSGGFGGGSSQGSSLGSLLFPVPMQHGGGQAGVSGERRLVSASAFSNVGKFHSGKSGVGHNEVMALLEKSESVFTADQTQRMAEGLSASLDTGDGKDTGGGKTVVELRLSPDVEARVVETARGEAVEITRSSIRQYDKKVLPTRAKEVVSKNVFSGGSI